MPAPQLHTALCDLGYYPGDEDIDDFYFGEGTQSALMTMQVRPPPRRAGRPSCLGAGCRARWGRGARGAAIAQQQLLVPARQAQQGGPAAPLLHLAAEPPPPRPTPASPPRPLPAAPAHSPQCCEGLEESGVADAATWAKLLGPGLAPKLSRDLTADMMLNMPGLDKLAGGAGSSGGAEGAAAAEGSSGAAAGSQPAYAELFTAAFSEAVAPTPEGGLQDVQQLRISDQVAAGGKLVSDTLQVEQRLQVAPGAASAQLSASIKADHEETYTGGGLGR